MLGFVELRRLRKWEGVIENAFLIIFILLVAGGQQYLGLSSRVIAIFLAMLLLVSIAFQNRFRNLYIFVFPSLQPLVDYERQKNDGEDWKKRNRTSQIVTFIFFMGLIFLAIYPSRIQFDLGAILPGLVGLNIGRYFRNRKIDE